MEGVRGLNKMSGDTWIASAARGEPRCVWRAACSSGFLHSRKETKEGTLIGLNPFKFFKMDFYDITYTSSVRKGFSTRLSVHKNRNIQAITWVEVVMWMSTWLLPTCWQSRASLWSEFHQNTVWQHWKTAAECLQGGSVQMNFLPGGVGNAAVGLMVFFDSTRSRKLHHKVSHRSRSNNVSLTEAHINVYVTVCF